MLSLTTIRQTPPTPPPRDAILSPLPKGPPYAWGSLIPLSSIYTMTASSPRRAPHESSPSSRPHSPSFNVKDMLARSSSSATGGGVLLSPVILESSIVPSTQDEIPQVESEIADFQMDDNNSSVNTSPPVVRKKKGEISARRRSVETSTLTETYEEVNTPGAEQQKPLGAPEKGERRETSSSKRAPGVQNADDVFFTGDPTPGPVAAGRSRESVTFSDVDIGGHSMRTKGVNGNSNGELGAADQLLTNGRFTPSPSPGVENVRDSYTPTPAPKKQRSKMLEVPEPNKSNRNESRAREGKTDNGAQTSQEKRQSSRSMAANPLLHLRYPTTHTATIEVQHHEGIKVTTSPRSGGRLSLQVDVETIHRHGYTSTIRTGRSGAMTVTVRPNDSSPPPQATKSQRSSRDYAATSVAPTPSQTPVPSHQDQSAAPNEHEASPASRTTPAITPFNRRSLQSQLVRRSITPTALTPPRQMSPASVTSSMNLIDLSGSVEGSTPRRRRSVRKVGRLEDLKKESPVSPRRSRGSGHLPDNRTGSPRRSRGSGNLLDTLKEQGPEQKDTNDNLNANAPLQPACHAPSTWTGARYRERIDSHRETDQEGEQGYEGAEFHDAMSTQYSNTEGASPRTNRSDSVGCAAGEAAWTTTGGRAANGDASGAYKPAVRASQDDEQRKSENVEVNTRAASMGSGLVISGVGSGLEVEMAGGWI